MINLKNQIKQQLQQGTTNLAIVLILVSVGRLVVNVMTDEFVYKK